MARQRSAAAPPPGATPAVAEAGVLADLPPGSRAVVLGMTADAPPAVVRRLEDLGLTAGTTVEVVRRAPLRDPVVYRVKDYDLCLRRAQAVCVLARETG